MANTLFVDNSTVIVASWLNDINTTVYNLLGNGTVVPADVATLRTNIGLGNVTNTSDTNKPVSTPQQTALNLKASITALTGSVVLPVGSTAQRDPAPLAGYLRYNNVTTAFEGYNGTVWGSIGGGGGAAGTGTDAVGYENDQLITQAFTVGQSAMTSGATISIATPAVTSIANTFIAGQPVRYTSTGTLPIGLSPNGQYFVSSAGLSVAGFQVATTEAAAIAGTGSIATSGTQSGVHSVGKIKNIQMVGLKVATGASFTVPTGAKAVIL